jgi:hypothetical protein
MKPYFQTGQILDISRAVANVLQAHGESHVLAFSEDVRPLGDVSELSRVGLGQLTLIDHALADGVQRGYPIVWMVTDNVESQASAPEAADTEVFYHKLRGPEVKKIVIFPLRQSPGTAGLVIYALLLSPAADETFEHEVAEFVGRARETMRTEALRMKPLDRDTVEVSYERVNLKPKVRGAVVYQVGQNIHEEVELRFKSRFEHLKIMDAKLVVPPSRVEFAPGSLLVPEMREIKISPERVTVDPQNETEQVYKVTIDLGKTGLRRDLDTYWKAAWSSNEDVDLKLSFLIQVPPENFKFRDNFLRDYHADTPQAARESGKVYRLDKLPMLLSASSTEIAAGSSVPIRVEYPWGPAIGFMIAIGLGFVLIIALIIGAAKAGGGLLGRLTRWEVTALTTHETALACEVNKGRVFVQGDEVGIISGSTFTAAEGVRLDAGGGQVKLEDDLRLRVVRKGRQFFLVFKRAGKGGGAGQMPSGPTPPPGGRPTTPTGRSAATTYKPRTR